MLRLSLAPYLICCIIIIVITRSPHPYESFTEPEMDSGCEEDPLEEDSFEEDEVESRVVEPVVEAVAEPVVKPVVKPVMEVVVEPVEPVGGLIVPVVSPPVELLEPGLASVQRIIDEVFSTVPVRLAPARAVI